MKRRKPRGKSPGRTAAARWLGTIVLLCIGLGCGFACLLSLAQAWGAPSTLAYAALTLAAFVAAALLGRRAAMTHL